MKGQCFTCMYRLFFKPEPDGTYSCCSVHGETVEDIDMGTGVSPKVLEHGINGKLCDLRRSGESICEPLEGEPFKIDPIRIEGEEELKKRLGL